ncbi:translesion DNA synthesis-associated protein ImuA [Kaarinaea lacus]
MNEQLQQLLRDNPAVWRGSDALDYVHQGISTGYEQLDASLPEHGWPRNALMEVITPRWGIGELKLLLPLMKSVTEQKRYLLWVSPPYMPYAPALASAGVDMDYVIVVRPETSCKDALWSIEKALQNDACALVLAWLNWLPNGVVRRLQLAAESGNSLGVLFRQYNNQHSPAALRLQLQPSPNAVQVQVLKARGTHRYRKVRIDFPCH